MTIAAAGPISLAEEYFRATLADVAAFRTFVGAADAAEALERIHHDALPAPAAEVYSEAEIAGLHPYALVETDPDQGYRTRQASVGESFEYVEAGTLMLRLARLVPDGTSLADAERGFKNSVGEILAGLWSLAGEPGYLAIVDMALVRLDRWHPDDEPGYGDAQGAVVRIAWGVDEG